MEKGCVGEVDLEGHKRALDEQGFTIASGVLSAEELVFLRGALDEIYATYDPERDGLERMPGYRFATNLVNRGPFFESIFLRSPVYDLARHLLGEDCILSSLNTLEPLPGHGDQSLHRDVESLPSGGPTGMNSLWVVDDLDRENGATRVVPFSHRGDDAKPAAESALYVEVPAGSVVVINAHLFHAASANRSGRRRRIMHGYFVRRGERQQLEQKRYLSPQVQARVSPLVRRVLALD